MGKIICKMDIAVYSKFLLLFWFLTHKCKCVTHFRKEFFITAYFLCLSESKNFHFTTSACHSTFFASFKTFIKTVSWCFAILSHCKMFISRKDNAKTYVVCNKHERTNPLFATLVLHLRPSPLLSSHLIQFIRAINDAAATEKCTSTSACNNSFKRLWNDNYNHYTIDNVFRKEKSFLKVLTERKQRNWICKK